MKLPSMPEIMTEMKRQYELNTGGPVPPLFEQLFYMIARLEADSYVAMQQMIDQSAVRKPTFKEMDEIIRFEGEAPVPLSLNGSCNHAWKTYTGLRESFDYCEHCDRKRNA